MKYHTDALFDDVASFEGELLLLGGSDVLFPHAVKLLQLTEPAVRRTIAAAAAGPRLLVIAPLGTESSSGERIGCLARIMSEPSEGDCVSVLLRGLTRVRFTPLSPRTQPESGSVRLAAVQALPDRYPQQPAIDRVRRRLELLQAFHELFPRETLRDTLGPLLEEELSLGGLCDLLACVLQLTNAEQTALLNEFNVDARTDLVQMRLREQLRRVRAGEFDFPPRFSPN